MSYNQEKRLARLGANFKGAIHNFVIGGGLGLIALMVAVSPVLLVYSGWSWLWLSLSILAGPMVVLSLVAIGCSIDMLTTTMQKLFSAINPKCSHPYSGEDISHSLILAAWHVPSMELLAEFLISLRPKQPKKYVGKDPCQKEIEWRRNTNQLLQDSLQYVKDFSLARRIRRALKNPHMQRDDRQILLYSVYTYLQPESEEVPYWKSVLGHWAARVPNSPQQTELARKVRVAARTPCADSTPTPKPAKPAGLRSPVKSAETAEAKTFAEDVYIDLRDIRFEILPIDEVKAALPKSINDPYLAWAVLQALLEPGKTNPVTGGLHRKQSLILGEVKRCFDSNNWRYPGSDACISIMKCLSDEGVLGKKHHGKFFNLDLHATGKSEEAAKLIRLLNRANQSRYFYSRQTVQ